MEFCRTLELSPQQFGGGVCRLPVSWLRTLPVVDEDNLFIQAPLPPPFQPAPPKFRFQYK
jgi:hypothetical protein